MGPASVLAHSGGDGDAFCDHERDWVDRDSDRPRAARYREVHVGHGGGGSGGGEVMAGEVDVVVCISICICMGTEDADAGQLINEHGSLSWNNGELIDWWQGGQ